MSLSGFPPHAPCPSRPEFGERDWPETPDIDADV